MHDVTKRPDLQGTQTKVAMCMACVHACMYEMKPILQLSMQNSVTSEMSPSGVVVLRTVFASLPLAANAEQHPKLPYCTHAIVAISCHS